MANVTFTAKIREARAEYASLLKARSPEAKKALPGARARLVRLLDAADKVRDHEGVPA